MAARAGAGAAAFVAAVARLIISQIEFEAARLSPPRPVENYDFEVRADGQGGAKVGSAEELADFCVDKRFTVTGGLKFLNLTFTPCGWLATGASAAAGGDAARR